MTVHDDDDGDEGDSQERPRQVPFDHGTSVIIGMFPSWYFIRVDLLVACFAARRYFSLHISSGYVRFAPRVICTELPQQSSDRTYRTFNTLHSISSPHTYIQYTHTGPRPAFLPTYCTYIRRARNSINTASAFPPPPPPSPTTYSPARPPAFPAWLLLCLQELRLTPDYSESTHHTYTHTHIYIYIRISRRRSHHAQYST